MLYHEKDFSVYFKSSNAIWTGIQILPVDFADPESVIKAVLTIVSFFQSDIKQSLSSFGDLQWGILHLFKRDYVVHIL